MLVVSIAEDQTGIIGKQEYVGQYNAIVGGSLSLQSNGFPDYRTSTAETARDVVNYFTSFERAGNVFVSFIIILPLISS